MPFNQLSSRFQAAVIGPHAQARRGESCHIRRPYSSRARRIRAIRPHRAPIAYGAQSRIARRLGVHRCTVSRDVAAIKEFCAFDWPMWGGWLA
jgi:hypothetical protein